MEAVPPQSRNMQVGPRHIVSVNPGGKAPHRVSDFALPELVLELKLGLHINLSTLTR